MQLRLKPETQRFVDDLLKSRAFPSLDAIIELALDQMAEAAMPEELDDETIAAINEGEAQADRGELVDFETAREMFLGPRSPETRARKSASPDA